MTPEDLLQERFDQHTRNERRDNVCFIALSGAWYLAAAVGSVMAMAAEGHPVVRYAGVAIASASPILGHLRETFLGMMSRHASWARLYQSLLVEISGATRSRREELTSRVLLLNVEDSTSYFAFVRELEMRGKALESPKQADNPKGTPAPKLQP